MTVSRPKESPIESGITSDISSILSSIEAEATFEADDALELEDRNLGGIVSVGRYSEEFVLVDN